MELEKLEEYFQEQRDKAIPVTEEQIAEMIERRRDTHTDEQLQNLAGKVGSKLLFYLIRSVRENVDKTQPKSISVEILKVWDDELPQLAVSLTEFYFAGPSASSVCMPEFIQTSLRGSYAPAN